LRRRFHDHLPYLLLLLQPGRQMLNLVARRAELPLLVLDSSIALPAYHYRQHPVMHVNAGQVSMCS